MSSRLVGPGAAQTRPRLEKAHSDVWFRMVYIEFVELVSSLGSKPRCTVTVKFCTIICLVVRYIVGMIDRLRAEARDR